MNTQQISAILSSDFITKNLFHGVFAVDQLSPEFVMECMS